MQFSTAFVAAATFALANAAAFTMPPQSFVGITAGTPLNITWGSASGPVTITLKNGDATALKTVETITTGATGTSLSWTPEKTLADGTYAFQIDDASGVPNYSVQFALSGGAASSSASSSGSSTASSTASSTGSSSSASVTSSSNSTSTASSSSSTGTGSTSSRSSSASRTGSSTSSSSTSTSTSAPGNTNAGSSIASPLAFIFLAFAAIMTLN